MLLTLHDKVITRNPRYTISHNGHRTWWLHLQEVEEKDRGQYMCQVNTNPMRSQVGYIDVVVPPKIDEQHTSSDTEVRENADVALRCRASGSPMPKIKWRREDEKDITLGNKRVPSVHGEMLNITKVNRLHMGAYLCIASNGVQPSVSKRILLNVNFNPMIWIPNQLVGAAVGTDVVIDCNLESHPRSVTFWSREGGIIIVSNTKYDSMIVETGVYKVQLKLRIKNLRMDDFGSYTCVAKNSLGETEGTIRLYDIPRPTVYPTTSQMVYTSHKSEGSQQTTSGKMVMGTWQNNLSKDGKEGVKADYATELANRDGSHGYLPPSDSQNFNHHEPNPREVQDAPTTSHAVSWTVAYYAFLLQMTVLWHGYLKTQ